MRRDVEEEERKMRRRRRRRKGRLTTWRENTVKYEPREDKIMKACWAATKKRRRKRRGRIKKERGDREGTK